MCEKKHDIKTITADELNSLYLENKQWKKVCEILGVTTSDLRKRRRELGMEIRPIHDYSDMTKEKMQELINKYKTSKGIAERLGCTPKSVQS